MFRLAEKLVYWRWDRYSRYGPVLKYLKSKYGHSRISILEIGCGDYSIGLYDGYRVDGLDIREPDSKKHLNNFFKNSIHSANIPLNSYDVVVCVDFLEHLPKDHREDAIKKMLNWARLELIMVFPEGRDAVKADKILYTHYKKNIHPYHIWFEEHLQFRVPRAVEIREYLKSYTSKKIINISVLKISDLKRHLMFNKFLMDKSYYRFLFKNKIVVLLDLMLGKVIKSKHYYRSMYIIELGT